MPRSIALRSFDHNGIVSKGDEVTFDRITMDALRRSRLVGPDLDGEQPLEKTEAQKAPVPTVGSLGPAPKPTKPKAVGKPPKAPRGGKNASASPAAPASTNETLPPPLPGVLPPPLPGA